MNSRLQDRIVLLTEVYKHRWDENLLRLPATDILIGRLIDFANADVPSDYLCFLQISNGILDLDDVNTVIASSKVWREHWPGCLILGSDGGEGHYLMDLLFDGRSSDDAPVLYFENEGLDLSNDTREWESFTQFFLDTFTQETLY